METDETKPVSDLELCDGKEKAESELEKCTSATEETKIDESSVPESPAHKSAKRRRSSVLNESIPNNSPDTLSRYGRQRRPKHDSDDFLDTDAVLGKSPKKNRKSLESPGTPILQRFRKQEKDDEKQHKSLMKEQTVEAQNESVVVADKPIKKSVAHSNSADTSTPEGNKMVQERVDFEAGDLIWGRVGHHPFWPCIIIDDPENHVFHKTDGRGRLSYHVLFYGDKGKRSWVPSNMILQFLGQQNFEMQVSAITNEMRKKDPKWFSGFNVKSAVKQQWDGAVRDAEEVMPMTRDERLDAFLSSMPQKKPRKSKAVENALDLDHDDNDFSFNDANDDKVEESTHSPVSEKKKAKNISKVESPPTEKKKAKNMSKVESPPTEKKKRGRPRKVDVSLDQGDMEVDEAVSKGTPGRPRKRKLQSEITGEEANDDSDWRGSTKKKKRKKKTEKKTTEEKAYGIFIKKHFEQVSDEHPDFSTDDSLKFLQNMWESKDEDERMKYLGLAGHDDLSEEESSSDEEPVNEQAGEKDAAAESTDSLKDTNQDESSAVVSKKKINLFRGLRFERVCQICEKAGNTIKCRGPCVGAFHAECVQRPEQITGPVFVEKSEEKPKKRGRKKKVDQSIPKPEVPKAKKEGRHRRIYAAEETDSDLDYAGGEDLGNLSDDGAVLKMIFGDTTAVPQVVMMTQEDSEEDENDEDVENDDGMEEALPLSNSGSSGSDFLCGDCAISRTPLCFVCARATDPSGEDSNRIRCSVGHCGKYYHLECLKVVWPQANYLINKGVVKNLTCPQHVCHTCVSDNPRDVTGRVTNEKLVRCIRCPTTYHYGNYCIPAGSEILTASQIICPRHYEPPKKGNHHINASWCFICSIGGSLICCDLCPSSFHVDCLKIKPPTGSFICEDCETGRYPLYNEVLWVKLGVYRWWPAYSLFPSEVPELVKSKPHKLGEFAVRFLGTKDHYWVDRGRCFLYHEGDCVGKTTNKSSMEGSYRQGVLEAMDLHKAHLEIRAQMKVLSKNGSRKPPQYIKIKTNKPVGSVKMIEIDNSNISPCECDPNSDHPCSPYVECLNRLLLVECDPNTCPAGEKCENQNFEKRIYPALEPCYTDGRGWGLKTLEDLKKGSFVIEYVGEVIDDEEYQRRLRIKHEEKDENYYFLTIDSNRMIDAGPKGNVSRFMNHSCQPNCETQKWTVEGDTRVGLFTICDVPAGTELTFNYNLESKGNEKKPCMCGSSICSGFIGAKKTKSEVTEPPVSGKKKRRKPRVRNVIEDICFLCDADKEAGDLITCSNKDCISKYHLHCLGLSSAPRGKWWCPRHRCNVCEKRSHKWCSYCTDSYCLVHLGNNLVNDPLHGDICEDHQKNPLSKEHQKKKRDEERKHKDEEKKKVDEEKRKHDEEERARRRSRREQISSEDDSGKEKHSHSDLSEDAMGTAKNSFESSGVDGTSVQDKVSNGLGKERFDLPHKVGKSRKSLSKANRTNEKAGTSPATVSKRGRKKKERTSEFESSHSSKDSVATKINGVDSARTEVPTYSGEVGQLHESIDLGEDEIPDADPSLDKFIVHTPAPIDDDPVNQMNEVSPKKKLISPHKKAASNDLSPSSATKRKRKPPLHKMDYINSLHKKPKDVFTVKTEKGGLIKVLDPKRSKESNFDKMDLSDKLKETATEFFSDEESPSIKVTKTHSKKSNHHTPSTPKPHHSNSTSMKSPGSPIGKSNHSHSSNVKTISPVVSKHVLPPTSSKKSKSSDILARARANGVKVMPPTRRENLATFAERPGTGLKVLKGRRLSDEANSSEKKTENLLGGLLQTGISKKSRPVLSKVEDNGVSGDDDLEEKVVENSSLSLPKQLLPRSMLSPPGKNVKPLSPKKQSPSAAVMGGSSLWNQDLNFF